MDNFDESQAQAVATTVANDDMTTGEKVFSAFVIVCIGFMLVGLASFHFVLIPRSADPRIFYFVVSIVWMYVLTLSATTAANLCYRSLLTIPTIVQCVALGVTVYFLPIAIWGGVLLYRRLQRAKAAGSRIAAPSPN